ncbi:hypothetical protein BGW41_001123 [Actinomortierella wolfii]|nr:hypothetical protein BGW41_001123 [Actinomortierella wolfii]
MPSSKGASSSSPPSSSSLVFEPLSARNAPAVSSLIFDSHMALVPKTFQFLKLKPFAGILFVVIMTAVYKFRGTSASNVMEMLVIFSGSIIAAQIILFLVILHRASSDAPTVEAVGGLARFELLEEKELAAMERTDSTNSEDSKSLRPGIIVPGKDNRFWVLEKNQVVIGCIGALVDKSKGTATLVHWAVEDKQQRKGAGNHILRRAMDDLSKDKSIDRIVVHLKAEQIPALRLFFRYGFDQVQREDWYLGQKVTLSITPKQWVKNKEKYDIEKPKTPL